MGLRFFLDLGCPTCINAGLLFTLLHIANLTSLLSSLREILENLYYLLKRGVVVHPKTVGVAVTVGGLPPAHYDFASKRCDSIEKKPRIHSAEKIQVRAAPPPSTRFKCLVGADSKKIDGIRDVRDVPLESPTDKLGDRDLLHRSGLLAEK
ncbi:hypothetical protein L3X38_011173 [Prunus dulcis]|uniref:Uncharacterized protein n=1 Tax=Prunus dulcis TaxID=3755 RepID=A0AAD4ZE06_PRUDU|nr:hypothetical protein L3X38_011173 [Prunus dulcis]